MIALALTCIALTGTLVLQQLLHNRTVNKLLDRIQAPERVMEEKVPEGPMPEAVNPEDDASYWAARGLTLDGERIT